MSKASEEKLAVLHGVVAEELTTILGTEAATAAHFGAAIAFLKNNNITADAATNEGLNALKDKLARRRAEKKKDFREQADAFADRLGDGGFHTGLPN